jgi:hypothetical protein
MIDDRIGPQTVSTANDPCTHLIRVEPGSPIMAEQGDRALAELSEDEITYQAEEDFLLCSPLGEMQQPPSNLPLAFDGPRRIPELRLSAPDIEQSIQALTVEYGRSPSEIEIAHRLGIGLKIYRQILIFLNDLEIETLFAEQRRKSRDEKECCLPNRSEDDPLFGCLRSEMRGLLRDAIEHLPHVQPLVACLYYSEESDSKTISVRLDPAEFSLSEISVSASLTVRASFANSLNRIDTKGITPGQNLHDLPPQRICAHASRVSGRSNSVPDVEGLQVYVTGSHNGWVPTNLPWEVFGWRDKWNRFFRSWYVINETQGKTEIRRQERYIRELGFDS